MRAAASNPSSPGIEMSRTTRSGESAPAAATAAWPSATVETTSKSDASRLVIAARVLSLSSATTMRGLTMLHRFYDMDDSRGAFFGSFEPTLHNFYPVLRGTSSRTARCSSVRVPP